MVEKYVSDNKITYPVGAGETCGGSYDFRGIPHAFLIRPSGIVEWDGHPADQELKGKIENLLPFVTMLGSKSENPAALAVARDVESSLIPALQLIQACSFAQAIKACEKVSKKSKASDKEKADAEHIINLVNKHGEELVAQTEKLMEEKDYYAADQLIEKIGKSFKSLPPAEKLKELAKKLKDAPDSKECIEAGKLFHKALACLKAGDKKSAKKSLEQLVKKYPDTIYTERAKAKLSELDN